MVAKVCIVLFFCIWCVQLSQQKPERCLKAPDVGPCRAMIRRSYYEATTNSCKEFIYGGCQGNDNNFEMISDCDNVCVTEKTTTVSGDLCSLKPETGMCRAFITRMYYDSDTNSCKNFTFGGCGGNENNFETTDDCQANCVKITTSEVGRCFLEPVTGLCRGRFPRLFYDSVSKTCKEFIYGGCGGNANNFQNVQECNEACASTSRSAADSKCYQAKKEGTCKMNIRRMFYDPLDNKCKEFIYGGCDGNANNFETQEKCIKECVQIESDSKCYQAKKEGTCKMKIPRMYYDPLDNKCKEFIYGGCDGNENNFETQQECHRECLQSDTQEECDGDCVESETDNICALNADQGNCKDMEFRFYYDSSKEKCEEFMYGGCGGNKNNFKFEADCKLRCGNAAPTYTVTSFYILIVCLPLMWTRLWL